MYIPYAYCSYATIKTFEKNHKNANDILKPLNFN